jgi:hypothetical protein
MANRKVHVEMELWTQQNLVFVIVVIRRRMLLLCEFLSFLSKFILHDRAEELQLTESTNNDIE